MAVAEVGRGGYRAGTAVHNALKDFEEIDLLIFVGVAGSLKDDIPIGSVVASTKAYNVHSNRYGAQVQARPADVDADFGLVQIARKVVRDGQWVLRIRNPLNHALPTGADYPGKTPPKAHTEPLACADGVVSGDAGDVLPTIRLSYSDSCAVETESYGTLFAATDEGLPAIVVRGISDCVTDKTPSSDAVRQPVAAAHAAAFAVELLATMVIGSGRNHGQAGQTEGDDRTTSTAVATSVESGSDEQSERVTIVIALEGTRSELTEANVHRAIEALRKGTGDQTIALCSIEYGSIYLVLDVSKTTAEFSRTYGKLKSAVESADLKFLGVTTERAFKQTKGLRDEILRASKEMMAWEKTLPDGQWLERRELPELLQQITDKNSSTHLLTGAAGSGKSALVSRAAIDLVAAGTAVLAIKADQLAPSVDSPTRLSEYLGLSVDVASAMRQIARISKVVLIVDQLDALAGYIDLQTDRLNLLLNLVREISGTPNLHVVLTCRTFEQEHDARLRAIEADVISLQPPSWNEIAKVLQARGISADGWPEPAQAMLRSPVALRIFLENHKPTSEYEVFASYHTMLDRIWEERLLSSPRNASAAKLLTELAGTMAEEETLWLPTARFQNAQSDLRWLEGLGLLTFARDGKTIGFSHQTLFEHTLARAFARGERGLASYVLEKQQSLFVRPKIWAGLSYLREADTRAYERESNILWTTQDLQRHVRYLLIEFVGQCKSPTHAEIRWMTNAASEMVGRAVVLRSIVGNHYWFPILANSIIADAMTDENLSAIALSVLSNAWQSSHKRVVELIRQNWMADKKWDNHLWHTLLSAPTWDADLLELALTVLERTDVAASSVNHLMSVVAVSRLDLALKIVRSALDVMLKRKRDELSAMVVPKLQDDASMSDRMIWQMKYSKNRKLEELLEGPGDWYDVGELAKADPQLFMRELWPWFERIFGELSREQSENEARSYLVDSSLATALRGEREPHREHTLVGALLDAVCELASVVPDQFRSWVSQVVSSELMVVHRLIAFGYAASPSEYANDAFAYLLGDSRRLKLGNYTNRFETTKTLIQAIVPHLAKKQISGLEKRIIGFQSFGNQRKRSAKDRRSLLQLARRDRLRLLGSLPSEVLSDKGKQLLVLEGRAVGVPRDEDVYVRGPKFIGSPMTAGEMQKAKDDDIVRFLLELPDETNWDRPGRFMEGGSIQASREFAEFARNNLRRAISIVKALPPGTHERPVGYAIEAMSAVDGSIDEIATLIVHLVEKGFHGEDFRSAVAKATKKWVDADSDVPVELVDLLEGWLQYPLKTNDSVGAAVETEKNDGAAEREDSEKRGRSVLWEPSGFMILPDGNFPILEAITAVLLKRAPSNLERWIEILKSHLSRDESPAVWRAMLPRLAFLGNGDRLKGEALLETVFSKYPMLLHSAEAVSLIAYVRWWIDENRLRQWLEVLKGSPNHHVRLAYGELIGLIGLTQPQMVWALEAINQIIADSKPGDEPQIGLAFSAANLWGERVARAAATDIIVALIRVGHPNLVRPVLSVFHRVDELVPDDATVQFLETLRQAPGFVTSSTDTFLPERLQTLLPHEAELVGELTLVLVEGWGSRLSTMSSSVTMAAPYLVDIALTLHRLGGSTRDVGVRIFEKLIELDAHGARQTLDQLDGRLRLGSQRPHPRFRRRRR